MKRRITMLFLVFHLLAAIAAAENLALQEGDILFTSSERGQGEAIIAATRSPYTHCGVVVEHQGTLMVLEAVQPVRVSTLSAFMANGRKEHFTAKRLRNPVSRDAYRTARAWASAQVGRDYDLDQPSVRRIIEQRYGGIQRVPMDEKVVAPSDLASSPLLVDVPKTMPR